MAALEASALGCQSNQKLPPAGSTCQQLKAPSSDGILAPPASAGAAVMLPLDACASEQRDKQRVKQPVKQLGVPPHRPPPSALPRGGADPLPLQHLYDCRRGHRYCDTADLAYGGPGAVIDLLFMRPRSDGYDRPTTEFHSDFQWSCSQIPSSFSWHDRDSFLSTTAFLSISGPTSGAYQAD
jgi:hypothetical protein